MLCPAENRFMLLYTFLKKNIGKKIMVKNVYYHILFGAKICSKSSKLVSYLYILLDGLCFLELEWNGRIAAG